MSLQTFQETLVSQNIAGTLFNTYTAAKTVIPPICLYSFRPNEIVIGKTFRVTVRGALSNIVTTPGTIVFQIMLGGIAVYTTGNIQLNATAHVLLPFTFEAILVCRAAGVTAAANFMGMGEVRGVQFTKTAAQTDGANTETVIQEPVTAPAVGTGFDSTIANILDFFAGFSISNVGNGIQLHQYLVESLN